MQIQARSVSEEGEKMKTMAYEVDGPIARITLNRPERGNGITLDLPVGEIAKDTALPADIQKHCYEIAAADGIVIVHPNWWGQPPAILKGWIDRVIRPGVAYEFLEEDAGEGVPNGLLKARTAIVFNTSNTESQREKRVFGDPLETLWKNCIFGLCGIDDVYRRMFNIVVTSSEEQRTAWLEEVRQIISYRFPRGGAL